MKNLSLLLFVWAAICSVSQAQIAKGTWSLGGSIAVSGSADRLKPDTTAATKGSYLNLTLHPTPQYFFAENWALRFGVGVNYQNQLSKTGNTSTYESHRISLNPTIGVRRYFFLDSIKQRFAFLLQGNVFYLQEMRFEQQQQHLFHHFSVGFNFQPGMAFFIKKRWSLELMLGSVGYSYSMMPGTTANYSYHNWSANLGLGVGFQYFFR